MNITILGSSGGEVPGQTLTGFKIDQSLLLDAGTIGQALTIDQQLEIRHVLITHAHLDHIHALPFLLDNLIGRVATPVQVYSSPEIIAALKTHIFNNVIWPDFTALPTPEQPVLTFCPIQPNRAFQIEHYTVRAVQVDHSFEALAYLISDANGTVVFSGDTGPVEALWETVKSLDDIKAIFLECSFAAKMADMAKLTHHLCTADITAELNKANVSDNCPVYLYHLKPSHRVDIIAETKNLQPYRVMIGTAGSCIQL